MKRKRVGLVGMNLDEGSEVIGALWTKEDYGKSHHYMIRLFESRIAAQSWAEGCFLDEPIALFRMECINPAEPTEQPPAPAEHPAEPGQASEESKQT